MQLPNDADLFDKIDFGVKMAVAEAILEHKRAGHSIFISENGKIVEIPPGDI